MRWQQGRARIDGMLAAGQLERVTASREHAERLLAQARAHLALATAGSSADLDPIGAYQLLYDASRKALAAVLENQGLRATSRGGHVAVLDAVRAQLDPPMGRRSALRPHAPHAQRRGVPPGRPAAGDRRGHPARPGARRGVHRARRAGAGRDGRRTEAPRLVRRRIGAGPATGESRAEPVSAASGQSSGGRRAVVGRSSGLMRPWRRIPAGSGTDQRPRTVPPFTFRICPVTLAAPAR